MNDSHDTSRSCAWTISRLDDWLDHGLGETEQASVDTHLEGCSACRVEAGGLRQLLADTAELPNALEPDRDLWPAIEAQLETQPRSPEQPAIWRAPWWQQVAAALLFATLGAGGAGWWLADSQNDRVALSGPGSDPDGVAISAPSSAVVPVAWVASPGDGFLQAEAEYLRAKEALWLAVVEHREELSPVQLELVESHLAVIDAALRDLRSALDKDPADPRLQRMLLANHRRGLDLLWDLVHSDNA